MSTYLRNNINIFYKTCITITEENPQTINTMLNYVLRKAQYAEIRFDFIDCNQIPLVLKLIKKKIKRCICTLRDNSEGGKFYGNNKKRVSLLSMIMDNKPFLLDLEYNIIKKNKNLLQFIKKMKNNILISWHDFDKTPGFIFLDGRLEQMKQISKNVKIVTMANSIADNIRILSLYKKSNVNLIAFSMGEYGKISRLFCVYLGSPFTYISINQPLVGQFKINSYKSIFKNIQ